MGKLEDLDEKDAVGARLARGTLAEIKARDDFIAATESMTRRGYLLLREMGLFGTRRLVDVDGGSLRVSRTVTTSMLLQTRGGRVGLASLRKHAQTTHSPAHAW
jgi:hypothetical protein